MASSRMAPAPREDRARDNGETQEGDGDAACRLQRVPPCQGSDPSDAAGYYLLSSKTRRRWILFSGSGPAVAEIIAARRAGAEADLRGVAVQLGVEAHGRHSLKGQAGLVAAFVLFLLAAAQPSPAIRCPLISSRCCATDTDPSTGCPYCICYLGQPCC